MNSNNLLFKFYCYCEWLVKYSWICITCWCQEWLLDWEGTTLRPLHIGPPMLYWWVREKIGLDKQHAIQVPKEMVDKWFKED